MPGVNTPKNPEGILGELYQKAYDHFSVDPENILEQARGQGLEVEEISDFLSLSEEEIAPLLGGDEMLLGALSGLSAGLGGVLTGAALAMPDIANVMIQSIRLVQRTSLAYGFDYRKPEESLNIWVALGMGLGLDIERYVMRTLATRAIELHLIPGILRRVVLPLIGRTIIGRIVRQGLRFVPLIGAVTGAGLNYTFLKQIRDKAQEYYRERRAGRKPLLVFE